MEIKETNPKRKFNCGNNVKTEIMASNIAIPVNIPK